MPTLRRILATTDFSACAATAVERAAYLAKTSGATLSLLHVVNQSRVTELARMLHEGLDDARAQAEATALCELQAHVELLARQYGVRAEAVRVTGSIAPAIVECADSDDADLLVIGARGDNPVRDFLLGSNAERVLRKTMRAVLIVRNNAMNEYRHILVPTDLSTHARDALQLALQLTPRATITLLHVFDAPLEAKLEFAGVSAADINAYREHGRREAEVALLEFIATLDAADQRRIVPQLGVGYPPGVILETARSLGAELIALGKHGRSPVDEWVLGSVTLHVLQNAPCDVLTADRRAQA